LDTNGLTNVDDPHPSMVETKATLLPALSFDFTYTLVTKHALKMSRHVSFFGIVKPARKFTAHFSIEIKNAQVWCHVAQK
jgi:hypothetical protein